MSDDGDDSGDVNIDDEGDGDGDDEVYDLDIGDDCNHSDGIVQLWIMRMMTTKMTMVAKCRRDDDNDVGQ